MRVREITVSVGTKLSKDYQSAELHMGYTVELEDDDDPLEVRDELRKDITGYIEDAVVEVFMATTRPGAKK